MEQNAECTYPAPGARLCTCGCGRSLEGRSKRCNYYEDKCRAKGYHTRQTADNPRPKKRTTKKQAVRHPNIEPVARRTEPVPAPSQPEAEPRPIKTREKTKKEKAVYDKEARQQTEEINEKLSWSLHTQASFCKLCQRPGGPKEKGGAGALRTKMGTPGAICEDCWAQVYPKEGS